jgi:hypothetical protein
MGPLVWINRLTFQRQFLKLELYSVLEVDDRHVAFCEYNGSVRIMLFQLKKTTGSNQFDPLFKIILDIIHRSNHCL